MVPLRCYTLQRNKNHFLKYLKWLCAHNFSRSNFEEAIKEDNDTSVFNFLARVRHIHSLEGEELCFR